MFVNGSKRFSMHVEVLFFQKTPMHWAAKNGHTEILEILLENKADVNARDSEQVENC